VHDHQQGLGVIMHARATRALPEVAVIACGALAQLVERLAAGLGLAVDVHPLPPLLHNRPERIAAAVEAELVRLRPRYPRLAIAYAACGAQAALDDVCARHGVARLPGAHCYDVLAGPDRIAELLTAEPGTYLLTDYLIRAFRRSVVVELGLDRYPQLREDYFRHYRRVVWLAQEPTPQLRAAAQDAATTLGLPLQELHVGTGGLAAALLDLLAPPALLAPLAPPDLLAPPEGSDPGLTAADPNHPRG
jgi:Protein of unknown function (DUF1638)